MCLRTARSSSFQLFTRLKAEFVVKERARPTVRLERIGLSPRPVERQDEVEPEPLAQRLLGHEALELRDGGRVTSEQELCLEPLLGADEA
ncbi:MAG: hypothetical protein MSC30_10265 [Gaiellaceae bacterium MAG52_C11]|nr:hypothetical protein [Candidatus Gaiellasilicea maunaloa]